MTFHAKMTVNDAVKQSAAALKVLTDANIDTCCGGNNTLEQAISESHLTLEELLGKLNQK